MNRDSQNKRQVLIDNLAEHLLNNGLHDTGLRVLAKAVGTSDRMLLHYFKDKNELMTAVLNKISDNFMDLLGSIDIERQPYFELLKQLSQAIHHPTVGLYSRIWLELAAFSSNEEQPFHDVSRKILDDFYAWIKTKIIYTGAVNEENLASFVLVMIEGFNFLKSIDRVDIIDRTIQFLSEGNHRN